LPVAGIGLVILQIAHLEGEVLLLGTGLFISGLIAMEVLSLWRPD
jgi:hypothetical protein